MKEQQARAVQLLVNGVAAPFDQPMISAADMGFLHGDSVFTTISVHEGHPVFWTDHLDRLEASANAFGYPDFPERSLLREEWDRIVSLQPERPRTMRLTLSRGRAEVPGIDARSDGITRVFLPGFRPAPSESFYRDGGAAELCPLAWNPADDPRFFHKTGNLLWVKLLRTMNGTADGVERLLVNRQAEILEGTISSVFAVDRHGLLRTAPLSCGILPGIMRARILAWAKETGQGVREIPVTVPELASCREIFLSSSTLPVLPLREIRSSSGVVRPPLPGTVALAFLRDYRDRILPRAVRE